MSVPTSFLFISFSYVQIYFFFLAAGESVSPLLAQYGAAKSYISMFSKALNVELKKSGVHVQCQVS